MKSYAVGLRDTNGAYCYLTNGWEEGDPPRSYDPALARKFDTTEEAEEAIAEAKKTHPCRERAYKVLPFPTERGYREPDVPYFSVRRRNYGHWDVWNEEGRMFAIRGGPGDFYIRDHRGHQQWYPQGMAQVQDAEHVCRLSHGGGDV